MLMVRFNHSGSGNGRVTVNNHCSSAIFSRPIVAHRQPELIGFARGLAEKRELPDSTGPASLHGLLHASVGNDQLAVVEHIMTHQLVN